MPKGLQGFQKGNKLMGFLGHHHSNKTKEKIRLANKGKISPMKGKKHTKETIIKMKMVKIGKPSGSKGKHWKIIDTSKMSKAREGEKNPNWKGGNSQLRIYKHYGNLEYKQWRKKIFERDNYTCQKCGQKSGIGRPLIIHPHHIKSYTFHPKLRYVVENGITLCVSCHHIEHWRH